MRVGVCVCEVYVWLLLFGELGGLVLQSPDLILQLLCTMGSQSRSEACAAAVTQPLTLLAGVVSWDASARWPHVKITRWDWIFADVIGVFSA